MRLAAALLLAASLGCGRARKDEVSSSNQTMRGVTMIESAGGRPTWVLEAGEARLSDTADIVDADRPTIRIHEEGREVATMRSRTGRFHVVRRDLLLDGDVVAYSLKEGTTLYTQLLNFDAARDKLWTERQVRIERPEGTVRGTGFEANPDLSRISIRKQEGTIR